MQKILKYKKVIMLSLIFVSLIIIVTATYVTEFSKNKVTVEDAFNKDEITRTYVDSEEFLSNFETFAVYLADDETQKKPYKDENGNIVKGQMTFKIAALKKDDSEYKGTISVVGRLGANWINYLSDKSSTVSVKTTGTYGYTYTPGKLEIKNIDQIFPAKGKLWFTSVENPTLYLLITWSEVDNTQYYTTLEYSYDEYNIEPVEIIIKAPETQPTE